MSRLIVELKNLSVGFDSPLIKNLNLQLEKGEIVAIIGTSGLGKTTLLRTIAGLIPKLSGQIIGKLRRRGGIGYIPQRLGLVRHASVYHNVELGARCGIKVNDGTGSFFNWSQRKAKVIHEIVQKMGLSDKIDEPIRRLSGGQQRRVATARTIAQNPELILADEFLSELDKDNSDSIIEIMKHHVKQTQCAMLLVEHNLERAHQIADRVINLDDYEIKISEEE